MKTKLLYLMSLVFLTACTNSKPTVTFKDVNEFNLGEQVSGCSIVKTINNNEVNDNQIFDNTIKINDIELACGVIDTKQSGEHQATYKIGENEYVYTYYVKDTQSPSIVTEDEVYVDLNSDFNIDDHVTFVDNGSVSFVMKGSVDTSQNGRYQVKVSAKDNAGNYTEKNIWVNVGEGGETHPIENDSSLARDPNAEKLIEEMNQLGKPQKEESNANIEHETVEHEQLLDNMVVLDPQCVAGVYEVEAETGLEAANNVMNEYDCWQVEAKPIINEDIEESANRYSVTCICSKNNAFKNEGTYTPNVIDENSQSLIDSE